MIWRNILINTSQHDNGQKVVKHRKNVWDTASSFKNAFGIIEALKISPSDSGWNAHIYPLRITKQSVLAVDNITIDVLTQRNVITNTLQHDHQQNAWNTALSFKDAFGIFQALAISPSNSAHYAHTDRSCIITEQRKYHFLPPGVACTTGLSHNRFTWLPL